MNSSEGRPREIAEKRILEMIRSGQLKPGEALSHARLAAALGVSVTPILHVFRNLEGLGILAHTRTGTTVVKEFTREEWFALCSVRETLERVAARSCALLCTDEEMALLNVRVRRLTECLQRQITGAKENDFSGDPVDDDVEFHHSIVRFSHLPVLEKLHEGIIFVTVSRHSIGQLGRRLSSIEEQVEEHANIMKAIQERSPDAAEEAIRHHLGNMRDRFQIEYKGAGDGAKNDDA